MTLGDQVPPNSHRTFSSGASVTSSNPTADDGSVDSAPMRYERYLDQLPLWPERGQHILAHFDEDSVIVYQAYRPSIADYAVKHQRFGGDFSYSRMSWIKPNFLWMMYRSGWAAKEGQEHVLAIRLQRPFFDSLLRDVVASTFGASHFSNHAEWKAAVAASDVRLQWDPDHDPTGRSVERRAVQLGLRGETLRTYGEKAVVDIEDITSFVISQRDHAEGDFMRLVIPEERVYVPSDPVAAKTVGIEDLPH